MMLRDLGQVLSNMVVQTQAAGPGNAVVRRLERRPAHLLADGPEVILMGDHCLVSHGVAPVCDGHGRPELFRSLAVLI